MVWGGGTGLREGEAVADDVFVPNIGTRERRKRLLAGLPGFVVGIVALVLLVVFSADRWWRIALLLPFWMGGIGFFQYRDKT
jgi:uncharacterized membrane protein YccC